MISMGCVCETVPVMKGFTNDWLNVVDCVGLQGTCSGVRDQVQDVSGVRVDVEADVHLGPGEVDDEVWVVLH